MSVGPVPAPGSTFTAEDGTVSTVLPEASDPNYDPSEEELNEYAVFIGIDPAEEPQLMWIAREGLRTPLPDPWRACQTGEDEIYYFNFTTGESLWDHPMDETFKQRVVDERAKLRATPKAAAAAKTATTTTTTNTTSSANAGKRTTVTSGATGSGATPPPAGAAPHAAPGAGSTKALSNALFGKPALGGAGKNPGLPPSLSRPGLPQPLPMRLGAAPDMPDFPSLNGSSSTTGVGGGGFASSLSNRPVGFSSPTTSTTAPVSGAKDIEANIRRRVEDEFAPKRRQLAIDWDRKYLEEKRAMEEEVKQHRRSLDASWELEKGKSSAQRNRDLQRELKEIEEKWQTRMKQVGDEVAASTKELAARQAELSSARGETVAELKARLDAQRQEELSKRRAVLQAAVDEEVARVAREQAETIAELKRREAAAVSTARAAIEAENTKRLQQQQVQSEKMVAALEEEIEKLRQELSQKQEGSFPAESRSGEASTAASAGGGKAVAEETAAAEATAEAAVEKAAAACAAEHTKLQKQYGEQIERLQQELNALQQTSPSANNNDSAPATPMKAPSSSGSTPAAAAAPLTLSAAEEDRLKREEDRLRKDLEASVRTFTQQTEALVLRQQRQRIPGTPTSATSSRAAGQSPTSAAANSAWGSPGLATTTVSPLAARLQQLESKHEERMRQLREDHKKAVKARNLPNPRESEQYARLFVERQKAWNAEHPAPSADSILPKLEAVPKSVMSMADMPEVPPPSEEEVKAAVAARLKQLREEHSKKQEQELAALEAKKRAELDAHMTSFREKRLAEVKEVIHKHEQELSARRPQVKAVPKDDATGAAAAAVAAATAAADKLKAQVREVEEALAESEAAHVKRMAALEGQISALEAAIKDLSDAEAAARAEVESRKAGAASALAAPNPDPVVITQPDYANYISTADAEAEEAAVHAKWRAALESLQRELREASVAAAEALTQRASSRPPVVPPGATTPTSMAVATLPPTSYATPVQSRVRPRMPGEDDFNEAGTQAGTRAYSQFDGVFMGPTPTMRQVSPGGGQYSVNASSIRASPVVLRDANVSLSTAGGPPVLGPPYATPNRVTAALPHPSYQPPSPYDSSPVVLREYGSAARAASQLYSAGSGGAAVPSPPSLSMPMTNTQGSGYGDVPTSATSIHAERVARLHELLRQRRHELRARQELLEALREDWRRDMHACKERGDRRKAALLKEVKADLEDEARALNREVISLKEAAERLRLEESRLQARSRVTTDDTACIGDGTALLHTLLRVAERTERLETMLLNHTLSQQRHSSVEAVEEGRGPTDRTRRRDDQQNSLQDPQPQQGPRATTSPSEKGGRIEHWLQEQHT